MDDYSKIDEAIHALEVEWIKPAASVMKRLDETQDGISVLPEPNKSEAAIQFLAIVQDRYRRDIDSKNQAQKQYERSERANIAYSIYNKVSNDVLEDIYDQVSQEFSKFYKAINDDEGSFVGELQAEPAKLNFNVDFYGRGSFPPGAYHSEGHQDGMGLCLYLALMKHTLGNKFTFAVLDDVLMSVDTNHRREVCRLLKTEFPDTQFILTTHDRVWLQFMNTEGLVRRSQFFGGWNVETGPRIWDDKDVWAEIDVALGSDDVPRAASLLRRYLEYTSAVLADNMRARIEYRGDTNYDLGDLLPSALKSWRERLEKGLKAAKKWGKSELEVDLDKQIEQAKQLVAKSNAEQWAINKSVHFNGWVDLTPSEFSVVVNSFHELIGALRCQESQCGGFPYVSPRKGPPEQLRCSCGAINVNLKAE